MKHLLSKKHCSYITNGKQCLLPAIVGTPSLSLCRGGGLSLQPNFQKGGNLTEPQLLEGVTFFRGVGCSFHIKIN